MVMSTYSRVALFGGVYNNHLALRAAIEDAGRRGVEKMFCLGDLGAFGPNPDKVFPLLIEAGVETMQGNYDHSIGNNLADCQCGYTDPADNYYARLSYQYTYTKTSPRWRPWLAGLPGEIRFSLGGDSGEAEHGRGARATGQEAEHGRGARATGQEAEHGRGARVTGQEAEHGRGARVTGQEAEHGRGARVTRVLCCHGSPRKTNEFLWESTTPTHLLEKFCDDFSADILVATHTGLPWIRALSGGRLFVNCGVIGRPANDGTARVGYVILDAGRPRAAEYISLAYDHEGLAAEMEGEGLPGAFVETIRTGWWTTCLEVLPAKERGRGRH
jgi:diadenosine tetraphosphatase ApaH/serine/threonine PP2A family protein phosphatase